MVAPSAGRRSPGPFRCPASAFTVSRWRARLIPLGTVHVQTLYDGHDARIPMLDIEDNEFCIDLELLTK